MACTGKGSLSPMEALKLFAISEDLSDKEFETYLRDHLQVGNREEVLEAHEIVKKYRPKLARKVEAELFNKGNQEAFSALRAHLIGKTIKDVRKAEAGYGIELVFEDSDVVTCQIEGGKDSAEPKGLLHWFVARVNLKEWFRT